MAVPETAVWLPGSAMATVLVTVQVKGSCREKPAASVAVTVTGRGARPVVGVPVMVPVRG